MKKSSVFVLFLLLIGIQLRGQAPVIIESTGWLESASVQWSPVADAESYHVYYSGEGVTDRKIDNSLIRSYGSYFRADVLGLKAGSYTLKVAPVLSGAEGSATVTGSVTVQAHDRSGFAFSAHSTFKTGSGAYNEDGTLRTGAQVVYVTAKNAKTVQLDVKESASKTTTCTGIGEILKIRQKGYDKTPLAIRFVGKVTDADMAGQINSTSLLEVKGKNAYSEMNVTVEGVGDDATLYGWGILVRQCGNVEVRNVGLMMFPEDGVSLDTDNYNIWVHNCDFFYGKNGGGDKDKGDGSLDSKTSGYVSISYNHFWDSGKCNLLGNGTEDPEVLTYHHNWYDHSDSRHPRVRFHTVHVYNNFYDGNSKYGIGAAKGGPSIFVENNYFRKCKYPMLISMQGSDIAGGGGGTFSSEDGGIIKAYNNYIEGAGRFSPYSASNAAGFDFDAYVATAREEQVPASVVTKKGGASYNNFDTNSAIMYAYTADSPEEAKDKVRLYAGRMEGGDFTWTFDNAVDDALSAINPALDAKIKAYQTAVVFIQGEDSSTGGGDEGGGDEGGGDEGGGSSNACIKEYVQATNINTDNAFTIAGSSSSNGGAQTYNGVTLSSGLKMDSKGSIGFATTTDQAILTVGVNSKTSGGSLKINDAKLITAIGTALEEKTITLGNAGDYTIIKGDNENYVYYVIVRENCTTSIPVLTTKEVKSVSYHDLLGRSVAASAQGILIVKTTYTDGSSTSGKVYKLNQ